MKKHYCERDLLEMDRAGNHYGNHVMALTAEQLHSKSDIAAELGWRDMQIAELKAQCDALAAENAALKESREVLAKNSLEACNEVYCAGYRNTALHDGLMESTGNRNAYPNPIRTMVDEATKQLATPATDAYLNSVRADAISSALDASSNHCDTDCVMDAYDCSYEIAEMRSAGAIALHDGLVAYAAQLRAGEPS